MTEPIVVAIIAFVGVCVLATPGFLAWRDAKRAALAVVQAASNAADAAAETQRIAAAVAAAVDALNIRVDGRLTQLLTLTEQRAILAGRAEGVAGEQARTRDAES